LLNRRKCCNYRGIEPRRFFLTDVARPLQIKRFNAWVFLRRPDLRPTALRRPAGGGAGTMLRHESGKAPPTFWSAVSDLVVNRRASLNLRGRSCAGIDHIDSGTLFDYRLQSVNSFIAGRCLKCTRPAMEISTDFDANGTPWHPCGSAASRVAAATRCAH